MRPPDDAERRPRSGRRIQNLTTTDRSSAITNHGTRPAEDCVDQLVEAGRFAEAAEHALLAALLDDNGIAEAAEGAVLLIGRARTFIAMAIVTEVAA